MEKGWEWERGKLCANDKMKKKQAALHTVILSSSNTFPPFLYRYNLENFEGSCKNFFFLEINDKEHLDSEK